MIAVFKFLFFTKTGRISAAFLLGMVLVASVYALGGSRALLRDRAEDLEAALTLEQERARDDAFLQKLENERLCLEYFRHSDRMRNREECRALRGVYGEQP